MSELSPVISALALILVVAGLFSLLFKWLKQPVVLAYIVAGVVISIFIHREDPAHGIIEMWAEIGIIFLLFGMGLEFSFKKLLKVSATALVATLFIVVCMIGVGYFTGICFGWPPMTGLFLGAMLCISSTLIIIKVFADLQLSNRNFAGIVMGILIIEDLVAVLLMVLLSTIAVSKHFEGAELLYKSFELIAFLLFWFILGTFLIPSLFRRMKRFMNDETTLIVSIAFCAGMVFLATHAGFSSALGAFMMGSILAETMDSERIERLITPVKDFFGVIFFVSVGMMVHISDLGRHVAPVLIISLIVVVGRMIISAGGVLFAGQNLKTAVPVGFALAQIGEFSYIIGALGLSLHVIDEDLYQIIVAVSVITIFTMPFMMKAADPAYRWLERTLPLKWQRFFNRDTSGARPVNQDSLWKKLLKEMAVVVSIYYFICIGIVNIALYYGAPWMRYWIPGMRGKIVLATLTIALLAPLLRAIIIKKNHSEEYVRLWKSNKINRAPLLFTILFRMFLCAGLIVYVLSYLFQVDYVIAFVPAMLLLTLFIFSKQLKRHSIFIERRFKENYHEKEKFRESRAPVTQGFANHVLERDLHLADFAVLPYYTIAGKTLKELKFRQYFGVNVVTILRGDLRINIPNGNERIYPNDHLLVLGTDRQMELFQQRLEEKQRKYAGMEAEQAVPEVRMKQIQIEPGSILAGKTVRTSGIHEQFGCLLVAIERKNTSMQNPDPDLQLEEEDVLWLIGEYDKIRSLAAGQLNVAARRGAGHTT